jgi:hypothetical protein
MAIKTKLVENLDDKTWTRFTGYCKAERLLTGNVLSDILEDFLNKKNKKNKRGK